MFKKMYRHSDFIGAQISPPNIITVITKDGVETYTSNTEVFRSEATLDKTAKELKGTTRGKDKIARLFIEPTVVRKGRFTITLYDPLSYSSVG